MHKVHYVVVSQKTALIPLRQIYPECSKLLADLPMASNLQCLSGPCPKDQRCMSTLAERVHLFFEHVAPSVTHLLTYFKTPSGSIRAGIFTREMGEPRVITCNPHGMQKLQSIGAVHSTILDESFFRNSYVPVSSLLKNP